MLRKILPHPFLTLTLIVVWQMLVNKLTFGNLVLGTILGLIIPIITSPYWPNRPRLSSLPRIVEFVLVVLWALKIKPPAGVSNSFCHTVQKRLLNMRVKT